MQTFTIPGNYYFKGSMCITIIIRQGDDGIMDLYTDYNEKIGRAYSLDSLAKILYDLSTGVYA